MNKENIWPIVGHRNVVKILQKGIVNKKLAHAYIFSGAEHLGKSLVADYFIRSVLCEKQDGSFCNSCEFCKSLDRKIYPDFYEIELEEGKKNISIEQIREVSEKISKSSFLGNYKIILIKNAESLSLGAHNSLLKTLEEPSKKTLFILTTDNLELIPETVQSRSEIINFYPVKNKEIFNYILEKGIDASLAEEVSRFSKGKPGVAINCLQNKKLIKDYKQEVFDFLDLLNSSLKERFDYLEKNIGKGKKFSEKSVLAKSVLDRWLNVFRDLLLSKNLAKDEISNIFAKERINLLSRKYSSKMLMS